MYPISSCPLATLFPNGSMSAPSTPVICIPSRSDTHQASGHFFDGQSGTPIRHPPVSGGKTESKDRSVRRRMKMDPTTAQLSVVKSTTRNSQPAIAGICVQNSITSTPPTCFSRSVPTSSGIFQSHSIPSDTSPAKSAFHNKQTFPIESTPKRKTEKRTRRSRQHTYIDIGNFAGAKFSESPNANDVPMPPFLWREGMSSSSSCYSGDGPSTSSIDEASETESGSVENEKLQETPKWNNANANLRMTPLQLIAAVSGS